jgi:hypothetical protein
MLAIRLFRRGAAVAALTLFLVIPSPSAQAGSETPPEGPPWVRTLVEAQKKAVAKQVPIFVYLTKTH